MRGHHLQSHVTIRYRDHVTNEKRFISTFTRPMDPKRSRVVTYDNGTSPTKSRDTYRPRGHVTNQKRYISTFTRPMDPKVGT